MYYLFCFLHPYYRVVTRSLDTYKYIHTHKLGKSLNSWYIYIYIYRHAFTYIYTCIFIYIYVCVCVIYTYACTHTKLYLYTFKNCTKNYSWSLIPSSPPHYTLCLSLLVFCICFPDEFTVIGLVNLFTVCSSQHIKEWR